MENHYNKNREVLQIASDGRVTPLPFRQRPLLPEEQAKRLAYGSGEQERANDTYNTEQERGSK